MANTFVQLYVTTTTENAGMIRQVARLLSADRARKVSLGAMIVEALEHTFPERVADARSADGGIPDPERDFLASIGCDVES